jgi:dTDP-4-dehydrorhamnose reductase
MLGHVVARRFAERGYEVETSTERYSGSPADPLVEIVRASGCVAVINCLGSTKRRDGDRAGLYEANALLPVHLAARLARSQHIVHASTDCVFDGRRGGYRVDDEQNADDAYGFSKRLGETIAGRPNVTVLRVSIVGPEHADGRGLLAWFLRQPLSVNVSGYTNWRWNGITSLEWADAAIEVLADRHAAGRLPIRQPATPPVSKYELLCAFREVFGTAHTIVPVAAPSSLDRTLVPTDERSPIAEQLLRLRQWYGPGAPC